jgi:hypothetical protein
MKKEDVILKIETEIFPHRKCFFESGKGGFIEWLFRVHDYYRRTVSQNKTCFIRETTLINAYKKAKRILEKSNNKSKQFEINFFE